jgi:hypothetical protein
MSSPFQKKFSSKTPFHASVGPCGGPGQPSCEEELKRMAEKQGFNKSYQKSMSVSNAGNMKEFKGGSYMSKQNVNNAATAETSKRINAFTSDPGYKAFTKNPNATAIINSVKEFTKDASSANVTNASKYQTPTLGEAKNLINIGRKYTGSDDIMKDIGIVDKIKAGVAGTKLLLKYPNILRHGKRTYDRAK